MDIRKYFGAKGPAKPAAKGGSSAATADNEKAKRKKMVISDSSDEDEPKPVVKKSAKLVDSDDDDFAVAKKPVKSGDKGKPVGSSSGKKSSPAKTQLKEVNAKDFFGSSSSSKSSGTGSKPLLSQSPTTTTTTTITPAKKRKSSDVIIDESDDSNKKTSTRTSPGARQTKKARTHISPVSSPPKSSSSSSTTSSSTTSSKLSLSSKLSAFAKDKPSSKSGEGKKVEAKKQTPEKKYNKKGDLTVTARTPKEKVQESLSQTQSPGEIPGTPQGEWEEKKKVRQVAYQKFLSRGGARNPGSKVVPEGTPGCFGGLTFVLTGVYESLEREELTEIIKKYGGKVTTSLSRNTTHLVRGEEPGQSKIEKAEKLGTQVITEDDFLQLILDKRDNSKLKEKENKTPSPEKVNERVKEIKNESPTKEKKPETKEKKPEVKEKKPEVKEKKQDVGVKSSPGKRLEPPRVPKIEKMDAKQSPKVVESGSPSEMSGETELWVDKYKPANSKAIIGQQGDRSNMNKLKIWLRDWDRYNLKVGGGGGKSAPKPAPWAAANDNGAWAKAALLSGSPGVGKTTTAYLVAKELGYDVVEFNASDTRSKRLLQESVADVLNTTSLSSLFTNTDKVSSKRVLLMDEVDGMAGNEDRGGVAELINLIKTSKVPVIAMCNDRNHQKIRSLANHCFDLRFQRPRVEQIKAAMMSVCFKEKIKIKPEALTELIIGCGQDVRQVLHNLSMIRAGEMQEKMEVAQAKIEADKAKKTSIKLGPWDVCKKVFSADDHKTMSLYDKSDLYFYDYNLAGLFVQENYLTVTPQASKGNKKKTMALFSKAADSIAEGDIVERGIRSGMNWSLLPTAAIFSSVLPGEYLSGYQNGQIQFPAWLGKNSRRSKIDRILQELQMHTRLSAGVSKTAFNLDYSQTLRDHIIRPLVSRGSDGVEDAVSNMETYTLLREDLDGLLEVAQWPNKPDPMKNVDSKTKSAFTRKYNKESASLPYSVVQAVKKKAKESAGGEFLDGEEDDEGEEEDNDDNPESDAMIKVKKPSAAAAKKGKKEDDQAGSSKGKGKGKGKGK